MHHHNFSHEIPTVPWKWKQSEADAPVQLAADRLFDPYWTAFQNVDGVLTMPMN